MLENAASSYAPEKRWASHHFERKNVRLPAIWLPDLYQNRTSTSKQTMNFRTHHALLGGLLFARVSAITWFHCYQGFDVAISVDSAGGVPKDVGDGIAVGWNEIGVGEMPRI